MKKIISIIGARPQFIKHSTVNLALAKYFCLKIIHTGQHYDKNMSDIFFKQLALPTPDFSLNVKSTTHGEMTGVMLMKIEEILLKENPDAILLYGDTNSTLAGGLAGAKLNIPIIHIEAGLRSFNKEMPEEVNRIITDHISSFLFCPDETSKNNLKNESISNNVFVSGDVMKDALVKFSKNLEKPSNLETKYIFATIHRPYNTDNAERMDYLLNELNKLSNKVVFPIHPRTKTLLKKHNLPLTKYANILFIPPVGYNDCLRYQKFSECIITDSGGMQKEAYWLKKKCITIRKETEWIDTLKEGWNTLLYEDLTKLKDLTLSKNPISHNSQLYGDALASIKIAEILNEKI